MLGSPAIPAIAAIRLPTLGPTNRNLKSLSFSESAAATAAIAPRARSETRQHPSVLLRIDTALLSGGDELSRTVNQRRARPAQRYISTTAMRKATVPMTTASV